MRKVINKLVGRGAMAYALHPDGSLTVVDRKGQKHLFSRIDYEKLLPRTLGAAERGSQQGARSMGRESHAEPR